MLNIDLRSRTPIYEQIVDAVKEKIITGQWEADYGLPSVRELASSLAINPNTIQRSFKKLEEEGFIYSVRGRGSYVMRLNKALIYEEQAMVLKQMEPLILEGIKLGISRERVVELISQLYTDGGKQ